MSRVLGTRSSSILLVASTINAVFAIWANIHAVFAISREGGKACNGDIHKWECYHGIFCSRADVQV